MAQKHEEIVDQVMLDWSCENRGRLFKNANGKAWLGKLMDDRMVNNSHYIGILGATMIKYGLGIGTSDLVGWEYKRLYEPSGLTSFKAISLPIFCGIEVKTLQYPIVSDDQINWLNNLIAIGGKAYIAREYETGYKLIEWHIYKKREKIQEK